MKRNICWNNMISASSIRNFLLNDTLSDWLKYYNIIDVNQAHHKNILTKTIRKTKSKNNVFIDFIMNQGNEFEKFVYDELKSKYNCIQIAESYEARDVGKFENTVECMKKGYDIIYQGVFHSYTNNLYGCPDLLVRSDKLSEIFNCKIIDNVNSQKLNTNFHYVIIDIKHSNITMAANGINITNSNQIPAYKGQVYIYNKILGEIQGYQPRYGYILGKKYQYKNYDNYDYLSTLAVIDYKEYDKKYVQLVDDAVKWISNMRTNGHKWKLLPLPSVPELYPNMKVNNYNTFKEKLNKEIGEITGIWNCSIKNRENCHKRKIYSWKDEDCNSETMGFKPSKRAKIVDNIITINRENDKDINLEELFIYDWDNFSENKKEFYIDFETFDSNMGNLTGSSNNYIFMIGIGWEEHNKWNYKCFYLKQLSNRDERNLITDFYSFINDKSKTFNQQPILLHWTKAEQIFLKKKVVRNII